MRSTVLDKTDFMYSSCLPVSPWTTTLGVMMGTFKKRFRTSRRVISMLLQLSIPHISALYK